MYKIKVSNENQLILLCTRLEINSSIQQEIKEILNGTIDWNKVIEVSNRQRILPFLYYNLDRLNLQGIIPQDAFAVMKKCYYFNLRRNLMLEKEILLILELTNCEDISIILFRGFALMDTLYHNPGLRIMDDVDILIKEKEFKKIRDILTQLSYQEGCEEIPKKQHQRYQSVIAFSKRLSSNLTSIIEPHHSLAPARPYEINLPHLWERTQEKTINNRKLLYLSQEDTFLSIALHLRKHTRRLTLKFIVDIAELLNIYGDKLDWPYITKSAKTNHIITPVYFALYITNELLSASISPKILDEFRPNIIKAALIHFSLNKYNFFTLKKWRGTFIRFLLFDSLIDFIFYLWRVSFLERFAHERCFKKTKASITKTNPIDTYEKVKIEK